MEYKSKAYSSVVGKKQLRKETQGINCGWQIESVIQCPRLSKMYVTGSRTSLARYHFMIWGPRQDSG